MCSKKISTSVLKVDPDNPDKRLVESASKILRDGGLVAFPTETVYGLAANLMDKKAVARLYKVKKRPSSKPFTVHISNLNMIKKLGCSLTKDAERLIEKFWPGPLTIVLRSKYGEKTGFRMPDNRVAIELIETSKVPVAAPSANISGRPAPTTAEDVLEYLNGKIDLLLDAGRVRIGTESTVVDMTVSPPKILREGAIKAEELTRVLAQS